MDTSSSLIKALDVLTLLADHSDGIALPDLVTASGFPRSTVVRAVNTFCYYGLATRQGRQIILTQAFTEMTGTGRYQALRRRYRPVLESIAVTIHELVLLGIQDGHAIVHLDYIEGDQAVRVAPAPQTRHRLEQSAMGKLALSRRPDLLKDISDPKLHRELLKAKREKVAWNRGQSDPDMIALACPGFRNVPAEPIIAVAWPSFRFTEEQGRHAIVMIKEAIKAHTQVR